MILKIIIQGTTNCARLKYKYYRNSSEMETRKRDEYFQIMKVRYFILRHLRLILKEFKKQKKKKRKKKSKRFPKKDAVKYNFFVVYLKNVNFQNNIVQNLDFFTHNESKNVSNDLKSRQTSTFYRKQGKVDNLIIFYKQQIVGQARFFDSNGPTTRTRVTNES